MSDKFRPIPIDYANPVRRLSSPRAENKKKKIKIATAAAAVLLTATAGVIAVESYTQVPISTTTTDNQPATAGQQPESEQNDSLQSIHVVQRNDNLTTIARQYYPDADFISSRIIDVIISANVQNPDKQNKFSMLHVGDKIIMPRLNSRGEETDAITKGFEHMDSIRIGDKELILAGVLPEFNSAVFFVKDPEKKDEIERIPVTFGKQEQYIAGITVKKATLVENPNNASGFRVALEIAKQK